MIRRRPVNSSIGAIGTAEAFGLLSGWYLGADDVLHFPGDRPYRPIAEMRMRDERILFFEGSFVAVIQSDRSFEVCWMD